MAFEEGARCSKVGRLHAFGEPTIDGCELSQIVRTASALQSLARSRGCGAQLPGERSLFVRELDGSGQLGWRHACLQRSIVEPARAPMGQLPFGSEPGDHVGLR